MSWSHEQNTVLKVITRRLERGRRQVYDQRAPPRVTWCWHGDVIHSSVIMDIVGAARAGADGSEGVQRRGGGGAIAHHPTTVALIIGTNRGIAIVSLLVCFGSLLVSLVFLRVMWLHKQRQQIGSVPHLKLTQVSIEYKCGENSNIVTNINIQKSIEQPQ